MKNAAYAEVWVSVDELSDEEFLETLEESVEFIASHHPVSGSRCHPSSGSRGVSAGPVDGPDDTDDRIRTYITGPHC